MTTKSFLAANAKDLGRFIGTCVREGLMQFDDAATTRTAVSTHGTEDLVAAFDQGFTLGASGVED